MYIHTVLSFIFGIEHLPSQKALLLLSLDEHGTFLCSLKKCIQADEAWSFGLSFGSMREMASETEDCSGLWNRDSEVVSGGH